MGTIYKVEGPNSGKDVSVTITMLSGTGARIGQWNAAEFGILTGFEVDSNMQHFEIKSIQNDGEIFNEVLPAGAKCSLKLDRAGRKGRAGLEDLETLYRNRARQGDQASFEIMYQVKNRDGSTHTRQLVKAKPHNFKLGNYAAQQAVAQSVEFVAGDILDNS